MARGNLPVWVWILGGVVLLAAAGGGGTLAVQAVLAYWQRSANAQKWAPVLAAAEQANGLPADLLARMAYTESAYAQDVIDGTRSSSAGALGILQLEPQYFDTVQRPIPFSDQDTTDQINQAAGQVATLYKQLLPLASSSGQNPWALALAGYDAGAGAVKQYGGIPPYTETQNYVTGILADVPAANA
jgi:soluble lytic murein transglycosylase-like protein